MRRDFERQNVMPTAAKRAKMRQDTALYALCFAAFFIPESYSIGIIAYRLWQMFLFVIAIGSLGAFLAKGRISVRWCFLTFFFISFYLLSSLAHGADGSLAVMAFLTLKGIGFSSLCEIGFQRDMRACLAGFLAAGLSLCFVHFCTYLLFRDIVGGMQHGTISFMGYPASQHWFFFTHDNASIFYFLPVLAVSWLYAWRYSERVVPIALIATILAIVMYVDLWSATALISMIVFGGMIAVLFLWRRTCKKRGCNPAVKFPSPGMSVFLGCAVSVAVIILAPLDVLQSFVAQLGKAGAVYARITIWENSLGYFVANLFFGMGLQDTMTVIGQLTYDHSHNFLIQILYQGGLLSAILFIAWMSACSVRKKRCRKVSPELAVISGSIFLYLLVSTMDWYGAMVIPLILFAMLPYLEQE